MDPLRRDSIERAIRTPPEEKAKQALEMMSVAIWLRRAALRARFPTETGEQIEERVRRWLLRDE
ncbi:MAG: hypothetical protein ACJ79D_12535 [Myxococcales bacterium]